MTNSAMFRKITATVLVLFVMSLQNSFGQMYPALERALTRDFPEISNQDGRWVFYSWEANIKRMEKPFIKEVVPSYDCYQVSLTNYLGHHIVHSDCIVLFDSVQSKNILVIPFWYRGINDHLIKFFLNKQFNSKENLLGFLDELHEIMEIDSRFRFINKIVSDDLVTYDLVYINDDEGGENNNKKMSVLSYTIQQRIEIKIKELRITEYVLMNPMLQEKDPNKETIK